MILKKKKENCPSLSFMAILFAIKGFDFVEVIS